jgi:hypothetical protein
MPNELSAKDKATKATEALYQLRREEYARENYAVVNAVDTYLFEADTASRAKLYDLVRAS